MRLKEYYYICKSNSNLPSLYVIKPVTQAENKEFIITKWNFVYDALLSLKAIPMFSDLISKLFYEIPQASERKSEIKMTLNQKNLFTSTISKLNTKVTTIKELCESMEMDVVPNGFEVKFPVCSDFEEFAKNINDFNQFLKMCPIFHQDDVSLQLKSTDVGSFWLIVAIASGSATIVLSNLARIVDAALIIRSHLMTIEQQKEALRAMKQKNDLMDEITKTYKEVLTAVATTEAEKIRSEIEGEMAEEPNALSKSIESLGSLLSRGIEIYASIDSDSEIKAVFPPVSQQHLPASNPPQLTQSTENSNE